MLTAQKMKFYIKDFISKCDQIFVFCVVHINQPKIFYEMLCQKYLETSLHLVKKYEELPSVESNEVKKPFNFTQPKKMMLT